MNKKMPIFTVDISRHIDAIEAAKIAIEQQRMRDPTPMQSNVKANYVSGWVSHKENLNFSPIVDLAISCAKFISKDFFKADLDLICYNCWGARYEPGDHTVKHSHFPSEFAAVAYLEVDEGAAPIVFEDELTFHPKSGTMVIFPGILHHAVPTTTAGRLVVAMNIERKKDA